MQLTATTPLAMALCLAILCLGPGRGLVLACAALPFGSAAAVNLSGLGSVFIAELAILTLGLSALLKGAKGKDVLAIMHPRSAGLPLMFLIISTGIGALFLPRINAGLTEVYTLVRQADGATLALRPLWPAGTNIGQYFRFLLAGLAFGILAVTMMRFGSGQAARQAVLAASIVHLVLSALDLVAPLIGVNLVGIFRNAYVAILDDQVLLGVRRLIGGFPEPSAFGIYTIGLYGFWLRIWFGAPRSPLAFVMVVILIALLIRSTSSAAYFGLAVYTLIFLLWQLRSVARSSRAVVLYVALTFLVPLLMGGCVLAYQFVPALSDFANTIIFDKMTSASGSERMEWNLQALQNFAETYGMGAGIGSVRASGWAFAVLGSLGILGAVLYIWFLGMVFFARIKTVAGREVLSALQSGCAAILLLSLTILPQPNLGLAFFLMAGMVTGLHLRHVAQSDQHRPLWSSQEVLFCTSRV